ncbi:hypothetical protein E2C01_042788 [Portunus trituberculatus]|uniref:Uncharacterized protein n=1 Tax=Portunus trituberculatus TaxID=210409 RepID=A0A5B7FNH6_PORTR|nr:hypothetical protein [Portunus trituberculatus]
MWLPMTSDLSLNLSEHSVRVSFSHFVCATLCSASGNEFWRFTRNRWYQLG